MYKILSPDGGGSWSLLQLLSLNERYPGFSGHQVLREYDLVIANSGGSIVLAALAEDWLLSKALSLFEDETIRKSIFSKNKFMDRFFPADYTRLFGNFGPKYSTEKKGVAFQRLFPEIDKRQMFELPEFIGNDDLKIVVCTYDALNNRAKFFKSYDAKTGEAPVDSIKLTEAIHGSSNAPIQYFDFPARIEPKQEEPFELWDGALGGFNNPVMAGIIEAIKLGIPKNEISVVSLGTGNKLMSTEDKGQFFHVKERAKEERRKKLRLFKLKYQLKYFVKSVLNQAKTILYEPPDWANYIAMMFLFEAIPEEPSTRFIRLSPMVHIDESTPAEVVDLLKALYKLDMDLTEDEEIEIIKKCFEAWKNGAIKNQPIAFKIDNENNLHCVCGYKSYQEVMEKWKQPDELASHV
ncbi:MAG: hypothetical protein DWQ02_14790 [Bacteroidetes bacterium]|nr:MAG: hypothetical protein DWQ02_14790 [Bacteroidota bacterium]